MAPTQVEGIIEYHSDLQKRFESQSTRIKNFWQSFSREQRLNCMRGKGKFKDTKILRHAEDAGFTVQKTMLACLLVPEWNLRDVVESGPEYFLKLLEHRATTSLSDQFWKGPEGSDELQRKSGAKHFKRVSGAHDLAGNADVEMMVKPEDLTRADPQMHYLLRLCSPGMEPSDTSQCLTNIGNLHTLHPDERERLSQDEFEALCNLANAVGFWNDIQPILAQRKPSRNLQWRFLTEMKQLEEELDTLRDRFDIRNIVYPISKLRNPGVAEEAITRMSEFIEEATGQTMASAYEQIIEDCIKELHRRHYNLESAQPPSKDPFGSSSPSSTAPTRPKSQIQQKPEKAKMRPSKPPGNEFPEEQAEDAPPAPAQQNDTPPRVYRVRPATSDVFDALFDKSVAQPPVHWADFVSAMVDLGFSVEPLYGSVFTFLPSAEMGMLQSFTTHRPHGPKMEKYRVQSVARRLNRVYGWTRDTFELL
ncbi:hypothetical protein GE09DRAFT_1214022 [Coniochaeta sp. 2T2.1]|nr:hypothetical protein GE09DRAFT_1214022 [Coniochaeta sp. 2T2.1]